MDPLVSSIQDTIQAQWREISQLGIRLGRLEQRESLMANSTALTLSGDLAVNGGDITSTATTFNLLNATVTTLNLGGAATTLSMGAGAASTLNANFTTAINLNTSAIASNQTTVALLNATATTINAFGAATAVTVNTTGFGIGGAPKAKLHVYDQVAVSDHDYTASFAFVGAAGVLIASDSGNATIRIATYNANTTHDPLINFLTSGAQNWAIGIDNSDSDAFKIAMNSAFDGTNEFLKITTSGHVLPLATAGTQNLGDASNYWADISYKTLTDRGCLGWFDAGVELQDGRKVSDIEALLAIKRHPSELTVYGVPRLDYATMPKAVYKPAPRDKDGKALGADGAETTALISIMLGAIKELKADNDDLRAQLARIA